MFNYFVKKNLSFIINTLACNNFYFENESYYLLSVSVFFIDVENRFWRDLKQII